MKLLYPKRIVLVLTLLIATFSAQAQHTDDLLNLLIKNHLVSQQDADSLRAELALKEQQKRDKENQHGLTIGRALQVSGLIQARYQAFQQSNVNDAFDLHRARLDVKGNILSHWDYEVYTEFAGGNAKLLDAYTTYKFGDYLKITAGQFKVPFSLESLTSDSQLEFIDRSQVVEALAARSKDVIGNQNGRDLGAQISGSLLKLDDHYLFDYYFGVFNGAGYDVTTDNNKQKDIAARLVIRPIKGFEIGGDLYHGQDIWGASTKNQLRNRQGIDLRFVKGNFSIQGEYDKGTDGAIKRDGWFGQAAYFVVPKKLQLAFKVDDYDPTKTSRTDRSTWYIPGVNYYFNEWAKFTVDYSYRREEVPTAQIRNNVLEAQFQIAF